MNKEWVIIEGQCVILKWVPWKKILPYNQEDGELEKRGDIGERKKEVTGYGKKNKRRTTLINIPQC